MMAVVFEDFCLLFVFLICTSKAVSDLILGSRSRSDNSKWFLNLVGRMGEELTVSPVFRCCSCWVVNQKWNVDCAEIGTFSSWKIYSPLFCKLRFNNL